MYQRLRVQYKNGRKNKNAIKAKQLCCTQTTQVYRKERNKDS